MQNMALFILYNGAYSKKHESAGKLFSISGISPVFFFKMIFQLIPELNSARINSGQIFHCEILMNEDVIFLIGYSGDILAIGFRNRFRKLGR